MSCEIIKDQLRPLIEQYLVNLPTGSAPTAFGVAEVAHDFGVLSGYRQSSDTIGNCPDNNYYVDMVVGGKKYTFSSKTNWNGAVEWSVTTMLAG